MRATALVLTAVIAACGGETAPRSIGFGAAITLGVGEHPVTIALLDADGDGDPDAVVPGFLTADLTILLNDGGRLTAVGPVAVAGGSVQALAADLDRDGALELVLSMPNAHRLQILVADDLARALAGGRLDGEDAGAAWDVPPLERPSSFAAGDLDGDRHDDLVVQRLRTGDAVLLRGDGARRFTEAAPLSVPDRATALRVADLEGDGAPEITMLGAGGEVWLVRGEETAREATGAWPMDVVPAQLDGDPELELAGAVNQGDALFLVDLVAGGGIAVRELPTNGQPAALRAADLDADGHTDLVVAAKGADRVDIFRGDGAGGLVHALSLATGWGPSALEVADLDADGCLDLLVVNAFSNDVTVYLCDPV